MMPSMHLQVMRQPNQCTTNSPQKNKGDISRQRTKPFQEDSQMLGTHLPAAEQGEAGLENNLSFQNFLTIIHPVHLYNSSAGVSTPQGSNTCMKCWTFPNVHIIRISKNRPVIYLPFLLTNTAERLQAGLLVYQF